MNFVFLSRTGSYRGHHRRLRVKPACLRKTQKHHETVERTNLRWTKCDAFYIPTEVWIPSLETIVGLTFYVPGGYYFGSVDQER